VKGQGAARSKLSKPPRTVVCKRKKATEREDSTRAGRICRIYYEIKKRREGRKKATKQRTKDACEESLLKKRETQ